MGKKLRSVLALTAGAWVLVALGFGAGVLVGQASDQPPAVHQIQEDAPGWDCHTMGNRVCGPVR